MNWIRKNSRLVIFCLLIVLIIILNHIFGWSDYISDSDHLEFLSSMIRENFVMAALIYIGLTIISCVVLALPGVTFAILAGLLFGPWWGTLLCLIATTAGAILAFIAGRFFLKDSIKPMIAKNALLKRILFDEADKSDILLLAITRLVPLFPYNLQNFAYGITDISLESYSLYTFLFMMPGVALYTIGTAGFASEENRWLYLAIAGALLILVIFIGWYLRKKHLEGDSEEHICNEDTMINELIRSSEYRTALGLPDEVTEEYHMLAQGEYNINYMFTHPVTDERLVLRVNAGSQMHLERQIEYEAHALRLLTESGRTPRALYVDDSKRYTDHGILVMDYLEGVYPDYTKAEAMDAVMECLADIHAISIPEDEVIWGEPEEVPRDTIRLIAPADPAVSILDECEAMVKTYMDSPLGDDSIKERLRRLLDKGHEIAEQGCENCSLDPYRCCINTELNSTNFLYDGTCARLVDWEKPLYADPAQDLGHLLAPTTTFWKTTTVLTQEETDRLIDKYIEAVRGRFPTEGIRERTHRLIRITCLRGLTWCAMAWIQYQDPDKLIVNESTRLKLDDYLSDPFLKDIEMRFE